MGVLTTGNDWDDGDQVTEAGLDDMVNSAEFSSDAVDDSTTELASSAIVVKDGGITPAKLSTGKPSWNSSGNVSIGTESAAARLNVGLGLTSTVLLPTIDGDTVAVFHNLDASSGHLAAISIIANSGALTPGTCIINFGDENDENAGVISYSQTGNAFGFYTNGVGIGGTAALAIASDNDVVVAAKLRLGNYAAASLPTGEVGAIIYVTDGEKPGEASGSGSGVLAYYDGTSWISVHSGKVVNSADDGIVEQTGTTHTFSLGEELVEMNNASANTATVPPNSSVAFPIGYKLEVVQTGTGATTIVAGSGVTIRGTLTVGGQWNAVGLYKRATDEWVCIGGA